MTNDATNEQHDTLGLLGRRRRPPFARLLGGDRPRDRPRLRIRARRIDRLARAEQVGDGASTELTRPRATPLSYLRLADLLGVGAGESRRGGDPTSEDHSPDPTGDTVSAAEPTRLSVTRRITVTRDVGQSATEGGSRRPPGAGDRATGLRLPITGAVGDDRRESPTASGSDPETTPRQQSDTGHERADRRRITTLRPIQPRSPLGSASRAVRPVARGRRSVAVSASAVGSTVETATADDDRASTADAELAVPATGRRGGTPTGDGGSDSGTTESGLSASVATALAGDADGVTGFRDQSGLLGEGRAGSGQATAPTAARTVSDSPRLVVASRGSGTDTSATDDGNATGGGTAGGRGDAISSSPGVRGRGSDAADTTASSAVEPGTTPTRTATVDADSDAVSLPSATVERIVDRLSRRLQRDRRIARERGGR